MKMSGIVLSASVRQNLLSLQSTAALLATTQNDLATGNKVNSALDNPTEYFTAQGLNNRASDINNLLDGIGNGVQVLQAANTGITSLQSLVSSAQSIANQVLQSPVGYTTKSNVTSAAMTGATGTNLLASSTTASVGTALKNDDTTSVAITGATLLSGTASTTSNDLATGITATDTLVVNGVTFTFIAGATSSGTSIGIGDSVTDLLSTIDSAAGITSSISGGAITLTPGAAGLTLSGTALAKLGLSSVGDGLAGQTLSIASTGGGTATAITFGTAAGDISTLDGLNTALAANNLQATIDASTGAINIVTSNDAASSTIGAITGTSATVTGGAFKSVTCGGSG
jgi:flagellin